MAFGGNDSGRGYGNSEHEGPTRDGSVADSGDNGYGPNHEGGSSRRGGDGASDRNGSSSRSAAASSASEAFGGKGSDKKEGSTGLTGNDDGSLASGADNSSHISSVGGWESYGMSEADFNGENKQGLINKDTPVSSIGISNNKGTLDNMTHHVNEGNYNDEQVSQAKSVVNSFRTEQALNMAKPIVGATGPAGAAVMGAIDYAGRYLSDNPDSFDYGEKLGEASSLNSAADVGINIGSQALGVPSVVSGVAKGAYNNTNNPYNESISNLEKALGMNNNQPSSTGQPNNSSNGGSKGLLNYMQSKPTRPQQSTFAAPELPNLWDLTVTRGY